VPATEGPREGDRVVEVAIATRDKPLHAEGDVDYRFATESVPTLLQG